MFVPVGHGWFAGFLMSGAAPKGKGETPFLRLLLRGKWTAVDRA